MKTNRPVFLLPICGKLLKKLKFNSIFNFMDTRNMLSDYQAGLLPDYLILTVNEIDNAFDANPRLEVRVFSSVSPKHFIECGTKVFYVK